MPFSKLIIKAKSEGMRGTEAAKEIVNLMCENWEPLQEKYKAQPNAEQEEMIEHFNSAVEGLGDALFGDDSGEEEFKTFATDLNEEQEKEFITAVNEALLIQPE